MGEVVAKMMLMGVFGCGEVNVGEVVDKMVLMWVCGGEVNE